MMIGVVLVLGVALMALSVVLAVVSLAQTQPPRSAAAAFVAGVALMMLAAWLDPHPFRVQDIGAAWAHLASGHWMR